MLKKNPEPPIIFVVGNSRSGTTMMAMILGNHSEVFKFLELHYFEELWTSHDKNQNISKEDAINLASRLLCAQIEDYVFQVDSKRFNKDAEDILNAMETDVFTSENIYKAFLFYEALKGDKRIPCENTPRNVFYIDEILRYFPGARIINMVRDPRDILLSQKKKWKRWYLGSRGIPVMEAVRVFTNYHPVTISKLWNSSISTAEKYAGDERLLSFRYEDLIGAPEQSVRTICQFIGISFEDNMLAIPTGGSSNVKDDTSGQTGIIKDRVGNWKKGGLNPTEIYICQKMTGFLMKKHGYSPIAVRPNPLILIYYVISFPFKIALALMLNLKRMRNVTEAIKRRIK